MHAAGCRIANVWKLNSTSNLSDPAWNMPSGWRRILLYSGNLAGSGSPDQISVHPYFLVSFALPQFLSWRLAPSQAKCFDYITGCQPDSSCKSQWNSKLMNIYTVTSSSSLSQYPQSHSVSWYLAEGYGNGDQHCPIGPHGLRRTLLYFFTFSNFACEGEPTNQQCSN